PRASAGAAFGTRGSTGIKANISFEKQNSGRRSAGGNGRCPARAPHTGGHLQRADRMIENVLLWCLFGLIAGVVAQFVMPGRDPGQSANLRGFLITTALGILGAVVGGFLSSRLF